MKTRHALFAVGVFATLFGRIMPFQTFADALNTWQWRNPASPATHLNAVTHANGVTVAVGNSDTILSSVDGTNWISHAVGSINLVSVCYGNGRFVAVAGSDPFPASQSPPLLTVAFVLVSTNGTTWSSSIPIGFNPAHVTFGSGRFVALLSDEYGATSSFISTNGSNWSAGAKTNITSVLRGMAFGNGRFVGIASGSVGGTSMVSTDGTNWTVATYTNRLIDIIFDDGLFYGAGLGGVYRSADGINWTETSSDNSGSSALTAIARGGNRFVAQGTQLPRPVYGDLVEMTSTDGIQWATNAPSANGLTRDICWTGTKFVAVGDAGRISTSVDGLTWAHNTSFPLTSLSDLAFGQQIIVGVGKAPSFPLPASVTRAIVVSSNGVNWTVRIATNAPGLNAVTYGNGLFVAVGAGGKALRSTDSLTWDEQTCGTTQALYGVVFAGGKFVADGFAGTITVSPDGTTWSTKSSGLSKTLYAVTYGAGLYVAVGSSGTITTSPDGENWTPRSSGISDELLAVTYGNGKFVAVGNNRLWSTNGMDWVASPFTGSWSTQEKVIYVNGLFFSTGNGGFSFASTNGVDWEPRFIPSLSSPAGYYALLEYNGTVLMAGDYSAIVQSANFAATLTGTQQNNGFQLAITGELGRTYRVQATTNFAVWTDIGSCTCSQATNLFLDPTMSNFSARFYRLVSP